MSNIVQEIIARRRELQVVYDYMPHFGMDNDQPPVINLNAPGVYNSKEDLENGMSVKHRIELARHPSHFQAVPGSRIFRENVKNDIDQLDKFLARHTKHEPTSTTAISTNAPYLIAVWNELARAAMPVIYIDKPLTTASKARGVQKSHVKSPGAKIDIIADNGKRWIRVNTIKNSRLLAEFMEQDSYLTDSEDESCANMHTRAGELDNSLIQMGKILIAVAKESPLESVIPEVTLRLTRLQLDAESCAKLQNLGLRIVGSPRLLPSDSRENDPRICQTVEELLRMGIDVVLGEHDFAHPPQYHQICRNTKQTLLVASRDINLDLSVLIALISDITHAPLPASIEEAHMRFIPIPSERERSRRRRERQKQLQQNTSSQRESSSKGKATHSTGNAKSITRSFPGSSGRIIHGRGQDNTIKDSGESIHSRALANQAIKEMNTSLIDEIKLILGDRTTAPVRFWVSEEVRARCLRIVAKIGGPSERRRAGALLARVGDSDKTPKGVDTEVWTAMRLQYATTEEACTAYWGDSRHCYKCIPSLVPLSFYTEEGITSDASSVPDKSSEISMSDNPFWSALTSTCQNLLESGTVSHRRTIVHSSTSSTESEGETKPVASASVADDGGSEDEIVRAAVTRGNPRLTAHTVRTLAMGATARWTTLTANRAAIREVLRESKRPHAFVGSTSTKTKSEKGNLVEKPCLMDQWRADSSVGDEGVEITEEEVAAIWVVEPRSLAETMRGDYVPVP